MWKIIETRERKQITLPKLKDEIKKKKKFTKNSRLIGHLLREHQQLKDRNENEIQKAIFPR